MAEQGDEFNVFTCQLCEVDSMSPAEFAQHLREIHGFTSTGGRREMTMHMDAAKWHQTDYKWSQDGKVFAYQSIRCLRHGDDRALWSSDKPRRKSKKKGGA